MSWRQGHEAKFKYELFFNFMELYEHHFKNEDEVLVIWRRVSQCDVRQVIIVNLLNI